MSTNKTPNYQLHSWLPEDEFHVAEINENFASLDSSLKSEAQAAAQKHAALETALGQRIRMVTGSYTGNCAVNKSTPQCIELGFRPIAVLIGYGRGFVDNLSNPYGGLATADCDMMGTVTLYATGFTVVNDPDFKLRPNTADTAFCFLAFY